MTQPDSPIIPVSRSSAWAGRIVTALVAMFLLFDGGAKVMKVPAVLEASARLGFNEHAVQGIGAVLVVSTLLYLIPATSVLGAILLTGYLGGAIATHVRFGAPVFPIVFSSAFGVLAWLGLFLRDRRLRALIPLSHR